MPANGLVGWWKLLDGSGTVATDSSGNGNNGNLVGTPTWINTGPNGGGLSFRGPGFTDSVRIARAVVLEPSVVTISVWQKGPTAQNFRQGVFGKAYADDASTPFQSYQIGVHASDPTFSIYEMGTTFASYEVTVSGAVLDNVSWQNFLGTYDPAGVSPTMNSYLNGVLIGSNTNPNTPILYDTTSAGDLYLAANSSTAAKTYNGSITDVQVYNRILTAMEILDIYNGSDSQISGNAGVAGATISYTGPVSGGVVAGGGGTYTITGLPDGTYTITPSLTGYTFTPPSRTVIINGDNVSGVNFTATPISPVLPATTSILRGPHRGSRVTPPYNP